MFGSPQKCSTKDDCPDNVCYDQKYCVAIDPVTGKGVCYYGRCKRHDVCNQAYPECSTQFVPTTSVAFPTTSVPFPPTPEPTPTSTNENSAPVATADEGLGSGAIVGIVVGILVFIVIVGGLLWWKSKSKGDSKGDEEPSITTTSPSWREELSQDYVNMYKKPASAIPSPPSNRPPSHKPAQGSLDSFIRQKQLQDAMRYNFIK